MYKEDIVPAPQIYYRALITMTRSKKLHVALWMQVPPNILFSCFFFFSFHFPAPYFPPCQATTELKIKGKKTKRQKDKKNQKEGVKKQPEERTALDFVFHLFFFHFLQVSLQPNTASVRRRGPFEDEEIESLQCEIYKSSLRMSEETSKI